MVLRNNDKDNRMDPCVLCPYDSHLILLILLFLDATVGCES
jgi:hypothetical protein